jgi:hypothetical protein
MTSILGNSIINRAETSPILGVYDFRFSEIEKYVNTFFVFRSKRGPIV